MRRTLRFAYRSLWLVATLIAAGADAVLVAARHGFKPPLGVRTRWLQRNSRRVLRVFAASVKAGGGLPEAGLLVSNHLSYLDILLLGSLTPCVFVSKHEVRDWPVLGWCSRMAGTLFIRRERRSDVARIAREIHDVMQDGHLVVVFPEGTSSDGREVLPFKSSLLEPATGTDHELFAGHIRYSISEGSVESDVCYWGDMSFFPHALKILSLPRVAACVRFNRLQIGEGSRKDLARQLHAEVIRLKTAVADE